MMILKLLGRILAVLILGLLLLGGLEYLRGRRGPTPGPTPDSRAAGRLLLDRVLGASDAAGWRARTDPVRFGVEVSSVRLAPAPRRIVMALNPASRSAEFTLDDAPDVGYRYDAATETVTRKDGVPIPSPLSRVLPTLLPSIGFWSILPGAFDDSTAAVWRLPDSAGRARLAVRWPGEADWFLLDVDPATGRLAGLEFVDARFGVFFRWRGDYDGPALIDGVSMPREWRFRPASPVIDGLLGGRTLATLRFGSIG